MFYANYLKYFERARTEYLRVRGIGQQQLRDQTGAMFIVTDTQVQYRRPARLDDLLEITVDLQQAGGATMTFAQHAYCGERLLAEGTIRIGCVDAGTFRPRRIPTPVLQTLA